MNSIERVRAAIHFNGPDRVPKCRIINSDAQILPDLPSQKWMVGHGEDEEGFFPHPGDDMAIKTHFIRWKKPEWAKEWGKKDPRYKGINWLKVEREEIDEWGAIWNRSGDNNSMGHPGRPRLPDWSKYEEYMEKNTPDASDKSKYLLARLLGKFLGTGKYRLFSLNLAVREEVSYLRGFNNYLIDHSKHPQELKRMLEHVTNYYADKMKYSVKYGVKPHGFWIYEDAGTQTGPFFSPKTFRKFYEPVYRTLIDTAHDLKCEFHMHCCGKVDKLMPDLIEWGLDAIEFDSPRMNFYPDLKPYRGKIMMWGCVNIQSIYPNGTPEECEREVWHMVRNLGTKDGGFGAYYYPQRNHILVSKENQKAFTSGLKKYGNYSKISDWWWDASIPTVWKDNVVPPLPIQQ